MESQKKLKEIRARAEACLPGPWMWGGNTEVDRVVLCTRHSGMQFILEPAVQALDEVFDHYSLDSTPIEEARNEQWIKARCGAHEEWSSETECRCEALRGFLEGSIDPTCSPIHLEGLDGYTQLSRGLRHIPDLRVRTADWMKSYRDVARYEVLEGRTLRDHLAQGGQEHHLYREDIVGLATPELEFIAHAREDVDWLLERVETLEALLDQHQVPRF